MKCLLLSGYDADSHIEWREQLVELLAQLGHQCDVLAAPPRHFSWRVRSNGLWLSQRVESFDYELIIATSMVELTSFKALRPELAKTPTVLYFHENQFAYPDTEDMYNRVHIQLSSIMSALAADCLLFNSHYNRDSFLRGARQLAKKVPDTLDRTHIDRLSERSEVIPIAIDESWRQQNTASPDTRLIIWPHRWEFDKGLALMAAVLDGAKNYPDLSFVVCGQQFKKTPDYFVEAVERCEARGQILAKGHQPLIEFKRLLALANIVLSTSDHEFQGLSMLRGMAAGCMAVAPDDLVYPDYVAAIGRYPRQENVKDTADKVLERLAGPVEKGQVPRLYDVDQIQQAWSRVIAQIAN